MSGIKAVIFDCFGVLVESSLEPFCLKYFGDNTEKLDKVKELDRQANSGKISYEEFTHELAVLANCSYEKTKKYLENNPVNDRLFEFINTTLSGHYKIGFLSNASDNWLDELFSEEQLELFDDFVLSFEHGLAKPDSSIFSLSARRLGVSPAECLIVDDVADYCQAAEKVGMKVIQYENFEQFVIEADQILA